MKYWRAAFFIGGVFIFFLVIRRLAAADFAAFVRTLDWRYAALAFTSYLGVNAARVERMSLLLQSRVSRRELYSFVFLQNFLNVFFSFSGDAAYMSLVHRTKGVPFGENVASFISAKALDLIVLAGMFLAAVLTGASPLLAPFRLPALALFACVIGAAGSVCVRPMAVAAAIHAAARKLGIAERRFTGRILSFVSESARGFTLLDQKDIFIRISLWTLVNWLCTFLAGWLLLSGAHITLGTGDVLFAYTFPITISLMPFYAFGGFGSYEVSLLSGLVLVGVDSVQAAQAAVVIHMEELVFLFACAAAGIGLHLSKKTADAGLNI